MTTLPPAIPDAVAFAVFLASLVFSPTVTAIVAPYMVIVFASVLGASFALARRKRSSRLAALGYYFCVTGTAIIATVAIAAIVELGWELSPRATIAPIAWLIGFTGDDPKVWVAIVRVVLRRVFAMVDIVRGSGDKPGGTNGQNAE